MEGAQVGIGSMEGAIMEDGKKLLLTYITGVEGGEGKATVGLPEL